MNRTRPRTTSIVLGVAALSATAAVAVGSAEVLTQRSAPPTVAAFAPAGSGIGSGSNGWVPWGSRGDGDGSGSGSGSGADGTSPYGDGSTPQGSIGQGLGTGQSTQSPTAATEATTSQVVGVVDIETTVDYGQAEAAGTGMVLTSNGRVLTNNHVIDGATAIKVTVLSTGRTYTASVVGTSPTNDVAVLQLKGASNLATARLGDSSSVRVGARVTGVGNAGNAPGTSASAGTVTALGQSITASDTDGTDAENLTGLIRTSAAIQAGDSGGPLYDASGKVVGIDTAAQTSAQTGATVAGYAVPINHALDVADQIVSGVDNATIHQGLPAFLGVSLAPAASAHQDFGQDQGQASSGAAAGSTTIVGTVAGSAAARAGLQAGDTIVAIGGTNVSSQAAISAAMATHHPGDRVSLTWTDTTGSSHTATVTLGAGPAD